MLKLLSKIFREKPPAIDLTQEANMARMSRMRRKTVEIDAVSQESHEQIDSRKDILSKARDMEIGTSYKGYTSRARDEYDRRMGSLIKDWHERISHLPGFEVDPSS